MIFKKINAIVLLVLFLSFCSSDDKGLGNDEKKDSVREQYMSWIQRKDKAIPDLKQAIRSNQWRLRSHALLAIGKTKNSTLIPIVIEVLKSDEKRAVRNCSVIALGDLKADSAVPYLLKILDGDSSISKEKQVSPRLLVKALGKIGDKRAVNAVYNRLLKGNRSIQLIAVDSLIAIGDKNISYKILKDRKEIEKYKVERFASRILGELPISGSENYLLRQISKERIQNKIAAAISLGKIKSVKAVPFLVQSIAIKNRLLQKQSSEALIIINSIIAFEPLIRHFTDNEESVKMSSAYVLAHMRRPGIAPQVYRVMKNDKSVNAPAAYVLGRKRYRKASSLIQQRLHNKNLKGQEELAVSLGWIGDRSSIPLLIDVAQRKNYEGSIGAIWSLGQLKAQKAVPVLLDLMERDDVKLSVHIISALGSIGDRRAIDKLIDFQYGTRKKYAKIIGLALGKIGGSKVITFIKDNIDNGDTVQTMAAGSALIRIKDKSLLQYSLKLLDSKYHQTRRYGVRYLQKFNNKNYKTVQEWKQWARKQR